jgi:hypothetical protein
MNEVIYLEVDTSSSLLLKATVKIALKENNSLANTLQSFADLTVEICPSSCGENCQRVWTNNIISHRIVCTCSCHKLKNNATERLTQSPVALETATIEGKVDV